VTSVPDEHPLVLNVAGLLGESAGAFRDLQVRGVRLDLGEDLVQATGADVAAHLGRTNRGLVVHAGVRTALAETCSRCLRPIEVPVDVEVDEEVLPSLDLATGLALDRTGEPEVARLSDHHELDLETLVREAVQLAEPIAPLCRPDCRGLCPECGLDLNAGPHRHADAPVDPRLEVLRTFHVDEEG
jgi:uncharacterized protein